MKKIWLLNSVFAALMFITTSEAIAQDYGYTNTAMPLQQQKIDPLAEHITYMQQEWARIKYQVAGEDAKLDAIHKLEDHAKKVTASFPDRPEAKIWEGIILSTDAGIVKGMSALGKVKKAKTLFEESLRINPHALDGSAYTSLGSLYYQVPGWPIAFGDDDEAEKNLKHALSINPTGIDPNFFYGDFLLQDGRYEAAKVYLERALQAPNRSDRPLADAGRRREIKAALAQINGKMENDGKKKNFNQ